MTQVIKITKAQKDLLKGKKFMADSYFNPIQDQDGDWVISQQEADQCEFQFHWIKVLPKKDHKPVFNNIDYVSKKSTKINKSGL